MHHGVARTRYGQLDYARVWRALRRAFPGALGCCLMPNHIHLLVEGDPVAIQSTLRAILNNLGGPGQWERVPLPQEVHGAQKIRRQLRYLVLNPCRARLCAHPLGWLWSTHRDLVGGIVDPWTPWNRACVPLRTRSLDWIHRYLSADPTAELEPRPLSAPLPSSPLPTLPMADVICAARTATRDSSPETFRHAAVLLAMHQGWHNTQRVAQCLDLSPRWVRTLARRSSPRLLDPALRVLSEPRLLSVDPALPPRRTG